MKISFRTGFLFLALLSFAAVSHGADLPKGVQLFSQGPEALTPAIAQGADAGARIVDSPGPGFSRAWRLTSSRSVQNIEDLELAAYSVIPVEKDGAALLHLWLRTISSSDETGKGRMFVHVRKNGVDFNSSVIATLEAGGDWQEYWIPFVLIGTYPENGAVLRLRFGYPGQVVEVGGMEVLYYGTSVKASALPRTRFTYEGREEGAAWRKAALARIELIRKSNLVVRVLDANGEPVPGARVSIRQTRSAFEFGSCLQLYRLTSDAPEDVAYREKVLELFNAASPENDFKWPVWLGEWNSLARYDHGKAVDGLKWLKAHGIDARGHVLVWPGWKNLPKEVRQMHDEGHDDQILPFISTHIREMAEVSRGLMSEWDVLNEPYTNHDLMDIFGNQIMVDWFKEARVAMPGVRLVFNDFSNHDELVDAAHVAHFERSFRYLQAEGAPVDMLGLQAHISGQPNAPARVLATLDRYQRSSGGLPVRFTEFDIRTDDEDLQADYTRDFLILAYSHPTVAGVQFWGFWEKAHWIPVGAMFRGDWSEKPAAKVYRDLVLNKWRTNVDGATGRDGSFMTRAFQGDYEITVSGNGKTATTRATLAPGNYGAGINLTLK